MISFSCPSCSQKYKVKDEFVGKSVRCKQCDTEMRVPEGAVKLPETTAEATPRAGRGKPQQKSAPAPATATAAAGRSPLAKVLSIVGALALLGGGGFLASRYFSTPATDSSTKTPVEVKPGTVVSQTSQFQMGTMAPETVIQSIKVTITPEATAAIADIIDLRLGFGFPLRLNNMAAAKSLEPAFAALPTGSSLPAGATSLPAGEPTWFEFRQQKSEASSNDPLLTSHTLLSDLKVGDVSQIGFATNGEGDWQMASYTIEINGELFAENSDFRKSPSSTVVRNKYRVPFGIVFELYSHSYELTYSAGAYS